MNTPTLAPPLKNKDMRVTFRLEALHATRAPVPVNFLFFTGNSVRRLNSSTVSCAASRAS
jgi:hypothetical protein